MRGARGSFTRLRHRVTMPGELQNLTMTQERVQTESVSYPTPGDVLDDRYRLDEILNAGGMGVIMRARQLAMDRDVAVKLLLPSKVDRDITRARFEREVHLAKQLTHPNIIRLYDYGKHDKFLYIVMELLEGDDLKGLLRAEAPMPVGRALDIAVQVADALTDAHNRNIVHRDLKPGNIFIQKLGSNRDFVKVLDFGIAKSLDSREFDVTSTGEVSGTVAYIAPEIVQGAIPGKVADVYAVGVLLLEMITGRKVFEGHTVAETLMNHLKRPPRIPPTIANTKLGGVLEIALAKKPEDRYQDAQELLVALNSVVATVSPTLRLSEGEIQAVFGNAPRVDGRTSDDVIPDGGEPNTPNKTQVGYAMTDADPTRITPEDVSREAVQMAEVAPESESKSRTIDPAVMGAGTSAWKIAGVVVAMLIFGAVGGDWLWRNVLSPPQREEKPVTDTPPPAPEPEPIEVSLRSSPPGATVRTADGKTLGKTPLSTPMKEALVLEFEVEGHEVHTEIVDPDESREIEVTLQPLVTGGEVVATASTATQGALAAALVAAEQQDDTREARPKPKPRPKPKSKPKPKPKTEPVRENEQEGEESEEVVNLDIFGGKKGEPEKPKPPPEKTADELYQEARQHFIGGAYRQSIASCKKAVEKGATKCYALMANSYRQIGDTKNACRYYERAGIEHKSCMTLQNR